MAKILITGSKGVVGSWLTEVLVEQKHEVYGLDMLHDPREAGWEHQMFLLPSNYSRCDISQFRQLDRYFKKFGPFDFVYHTAAEFGRWNGEDYYEQLWQTNAIGTKHLLRLQEQLGFKLIHFSSSEVYGDYHEIMSEEVMRYVGIKQLNDYAMSKWVNEMQIANSRKFHKTQTVIVRLFNTYGPGEWYHAYRSVNSKFCYCALHDLPIVVYRGHTRTSSYIQDTCQTLSNIVANFKDGEIYNIGGNVEHTIEELVQIIWSSTNADPKLITYKDSEPLTTKDKKIDTSKAERDLGHKNTIGLEKGVNSTLSWMRGYYDIRSKKPELIIGPYIKMD